MDKARVVVMAAKMVRGREKRMKAGAKVIINIIWAIIFRGGIVRNNVILCTYVDAAVRQSDSTSPRLDEA